MALDPYFDEMYRARRHDMIVQARSMVTGSLSKLVPLRRPATLDPVDAAQRAKAAARRKTPGWQRRNAKAWDTKLFGRVGVPGPEVPTEDHTIEVPGFLEVRVRVYRPLTDAAGLRPAVLAFFGGSFQLGGLDWTSIDAAFRSRTADSGVVTVAVDYALAPEHRYPAAVEQGYAALHWLAENAAELGVDPDRIAVNGTSSGGNIAAAVTLLNRARAWHPLALQLLEVPALDLTGGHIDKRPLREMKIPLLMARRELVAVANAYLKDRSLAHRATASPLLADHHRGLPPAVVLTAEYDVLRGDGAAYGTALRESGVDASVVEYKGATHDAAMFRGVVPLAERWHRDVVAALGTLHTL
ncbi:acetyl esterase [Paramicrobacterium humi]|uniref:Acetyl esterase n=1 Tax=Paramicrobacterium humi TaxID=640635 RepID=A0A1H4MF23_9MICO|nr:alpha/beta hydrolase [Microbacterium humi]SEB81125.1 acetyl esterase [Microbacterium humi]